jgi:hypothetical protein
LQLKQRVSVRGAIMIGGPRVQVGLPHAGKTAEITVGSDTYQITVEDGITIAAPRTTSRDIKRHKAPTTTSPPEQSDERQRHGCLIDCAEPTGGA